MSADRVEPWVQTVSGVAFDLLTPRAEDVKVADIAHHLSRINRYSGATLGSCGYSVGQHSILVADVLATWGAPAAIQREGLLHDAGETYYGDWTSPVIRALRELGAGEAIKRLRHGVDVVVRHALGLAEEEPAIVKRADLVALAIERRFLMAECPRDWRLPEYPDTRWTALTALEPDTVCWTFTRRLAELDAVIATAEVRHAG